MQNLALTFIDFENIVKEAEQTYGSTIDFEEFANAIQKEHEKHKIKNCGVFAYSDFDTSEEGVQTKLFRLGIQAKHVVTKTNKEKRANASDIELSLDIQSFIYENPLINHYIIISADGDMLHVMQRLRLKGKTIHLIAFERVNKHLREIADYITLYDKNAPFLNKITNSQKERLARRLLNNKDIELLLYRLDQLESEKDFVAFSFFHKVITDKFNKERMDEALTQAKKAELIVSKKKENPHDPMNPTSTIEINQSNPIAKEILSKLKRGDGYSKK